MCAYSSQGVVLCPTKGQSLLSWMMGRVWHLSSTCNGRTVSRIAVCCWTAHFLLKGGRDPHQGGCREGRMLGLWKVESPPLGIKPRSPAWQAGILATILWRIETSCHHLSITKYTNHTLLHPPSSPHRLRDYRHLYYTQIKRFPTYKVGKCIRF